MANKKLKDLKKGDKVWLYDFTGTTPIQVESVKRDGHLMIITLKWDDSLFECYGHALGWTFSGYEIKHHWELVFTTSFDKALEREQSKERTRNLVPKLKDVIDRIEKI